MQIIGNGLNILAGAVCVTFGVYYRNDAPIEVLFEYASYCH